MSLATTILVVLGVILAYYGVMIAMDLYAEKMKKQESDASNEEPIDVTGQLQDFETRNISRQEDSASKKKEIVKWLGSSLSAQQMNRLMHDAAEGTPNARLQNILYMSGGSISTSDDD